MCRLTTFLNSVSNDLYLSFSRSNTYKAASPSASTSSRRRTCLTAVTWSASSGSCPRPSSRHPRTDSRSRISSFTQSRRPSPSEKRIETNELEKLNSKRSDASYFMTPTLNSKKKTSQNPLPSLSLSSFSMFFVICKNIGKLNLKKCDESI